MIHCEDHSQIENATSRLIEEGKTAFKFYPDSRPVDSEVSSTRTAMTIAEETMAPVYIVHLSSKLALEVCEQAQANDLQVYVETRPLYLHLTSERFEEQDAARYVGQPPLRDKEDVAALWNGLQRESIQTICTDHAPWSLEAKLDSGHTLENLRPGVANLQTMLPMLYSEGVARDRISLDLFVRTTSTNAAKLFGLYPGKGTIAVGSDADLVIFDPEHTRVIESGFLKSNADYSVFEGWEVTGWPSLTIRRGEVVFKEDEVDGAPGSGKLVRRGPVQNL